MPTRSAKIQASRALNSLLRYAAEKGPTDEVLTELRRAYVTAGRGDKGKITKRLSEIGGFSERDLLFIKG
jgi:hypothetical protein